MRNVRQGWAVVGVVITALAIVGVWQLDRAIADEKQVLEDEYLNGMIAVCDITGSQIPDCQDARSQIANARTRIGMFTLGFWLSIFSAIVGLVVLVIGLTGTESREQPKPQIEGFK